MTDTFFNSWWPVVVYFVGIIVWVSVVYINWQIAAEEDKNSNGFPIVGFMSLFWPFCLVVGVPMVVVMFPVLWICHNIAKKIKSKRGETK